MDKTCNKKWFKDLIYFRSKLTKKKHILKVLFKHGKSLFLNRHIGFTSV